MKGWHRKKRWNHRLAQWYIPSRCDEFGKIHFQTLPNPFPQRLHAFDSPFSILHTVAARRPKLYFAITISMSNWDCSNICHIAAASDGRRYCFAPRQSRHNLYDATMRIGLKVGLWWATWHLAPLSPSLYMLLHINAMDLLQWFIFDKEAAFGLDCLAVTKVALRETDRRRDERWPRRSLNLYDKDKIFD